MYEYSREEPRYAIAAYVLDTLTRGLSGDVSGLYYIIKHVVCLDAFVVTSRRFRVQQPIYKSIHIGL